MGDCIFHELGEASQDRICKVAPLEHPLLISRMAEDSRAEEAAVVGI